MPDSSLEAAPAKAPRKEGITMVLDRLAGLIEPEFERVSRYVDIVEIGWGLPLVWDEEQVRSRIRYYQRLGIRVSMSGTLLEYYYFQNAADSILQKAVRLGFDMVEVSDGIIDITPPEKAKLVKAAKAHGLAYQVAVGKKDPRTQLSLPETFSQIEEALALEPEKVVLEGRERGRDVGIYDENGDVRWAFLRAITSKFDHRSLVFEAPLETQQGALILELGPGVNLGNVALGSIAALQSERMGLRFDTFRVESAKEAIGGGPSVKFVFYVIKLQQPIDQRGIVAATQLPRRTVQKAAEYLLAHKLITEAPSFEDRRSRIYRTPSGSQMGQVR